MLSRVKTVVKRLLPGVQRAPTVGREWLALQRYRLAARARLSGGGKGRVAVVGCGVMGAFLCRSASLLDGWEVSAVLDLDEGKAGRLKANHAPKARVFTRYDDLLASDAFDVLAVATTAPSHADLVSRALESGVRKILLEKPVAVSLAEADGLVAKAQSVGATVHVDHMRRWGPCVRGLKRLFASGVVGRPVGAHFAYGRAGMAMIGTHLFDWMRQLFEAEFVRVSAVLDPEAEVTWRGAGFQDPSGRCAAEMAGGVHVTIDLSARLGAQQRCLILFGDEGRIEVDEANSTLSLLGGGARRWETPYDWNAQRPFALAEALLDVYEERAEGCTLTDGRAALECCIACHQSHRQHGAWVALPLHGVCREEAFPFA